MHIWREQKPEYRIQAWLCPLPALPYLIPPALPCWLHFWSVVRLPYVLWMTHLLVCPMSSHITVAMSWIHGSICFLSIRKQRRPALQFPVEAWDAGA